uniref:Uncharacterized protein n=1 Tax=Mycena chlorophos TaxID=658473 RepID=A0ABQ0LBN4_MYCCL|nr:predicted protein [Mycena chlorophos]
MFFQKRKRLLRFRPPLRELKFRRRTRHRKDVESERFGRLGSSLWERKVVAQQQLRQNNLDLQGSAGSPGQPCLPTPNTM